MNIVGGMSWDSAATFFHRVGVLPVAPARDHVTPSVIFYEFDKIAYFHAMRRSREPRVPQRKYNRGGLGERGGASEKLPELPRGEARVPNNTAHRERVDGIVPGDGYDASAIRHHDVLALPRDIKPGFLEGFDRPQVWNTRDLGHRLSRNVHFPQTLLPSELPGNIEIFPDGFFDIVQRFFFRDALRPATGESGARNAVALLSLHQSNRVLHINILRHRNEEDCFSQSSQRIRRGAENLFFVGRDAAGPRARAPQEELLNNFLCVLCGKSFNRGGLGGRGGEG